MVHGRFQYICMAKRQSQHGGIEWGDEVICREEHGRLITPYEFYQYLSQVTDADVEDIRTNFDVPDDVAIGVPSSNDILSHPPARQIALYVHYFVCGLRLPVHPFLRAALLDFGIRLTQLHPHALQSFIGMLVCWYCIGFKVGQILHFGSFEGCSF